MIDHLDCYRRTKNLCAVQLQLGQAKLESTVRYLGIKIDDAVEISEQTGLGGCQPQRIFSDGAAACNDGDAELLGDGACAAKSDQSCCYMPFRKYSGISCAEGLSTVH